MSAKYNYKIGDKVICILASKILKVEFGKSYTIIDIDDNNIHDIRIRVNSEHVYEKCCDYRFMPDTKASRLLYISKEVE